MKMSKWGISKRLSTEIKNDNDGGLLLIFHFYFFKIPHEKGKMGNFKTSNFGI
jgi:hypothetical protein